MKLDQNELSVTKDTRQEAQRKKDGIIANVRKRDVLDTKEHQIPQSTAHIFASNTVPQRGMHQDNVLYSLATMNNSTGVYRYVSPHQNLEQIRNWQRNCLDHQKVKLSNSTGLAYKT